jgi:hypothetical protein
MECKQKLQLVLFRHNVDQRNSQMYCYLHDFPLKKLDFSFLFTFYKLSVYEHFCRQENYSDVFTFPYGEDLNMRLECFIFYFNDYSCWLKRHAVGILVTTYTLYTLFHLLLQFMHTKIRFITICFLPSRLLPIIFLYVVRPRR